MDRLRTNISRGFGQPTVIFGQIIRGLRGDKDMGTLSARLGVKA